MAVVSTGMRAFIPLRPEDFDPTTEVHILADALTPPSLDETIHPFAENAYGP
jgi:hypothetical protein